MELEASNVDNDKVSKKELKRKMKEAKRKEHWQQKRKREKEKRKEKKKLKSTDSSVGSVAQDKNRKNTNKYRKEEEIEFSGSLVIDLQFDNLMTEKEVRSLASQIQFSYGTNITAENPFRMYLTSFGNQVEKQMMLHNGFNHWKGVSAEKRHYLDIFDKSKLVYLTSDSTNVLKDIDKTKVYIVGGIVDHNRLKGITYEKATEEGIETAQLPISEHLKVVGRKVLTVNQVVEILVNVVECKSWAEALERAIPSRKQLKSTDTTPIDNANGNEDNNVEDGLS